MQGGGRNVNLCRSKRGGNNRVNKSRGGGRGDGLKGVDFLKDFKFFYPKGPQPH